MTTRRTHPTSPTLYLAFELSLSKWKLGFATELNQRPRVRDIKAGDLGKLIDEIVRAREYFGLSKSTPVVSCYEAGRDGFWLHRQLESLAIDNRIVDPASIAVNRRSRRAKSDTIDVRLLLTCLIRSHQGEERVWSVVAVPSPAAEDNREMHRELRTLKDDRTRIVNRIRAHLHRHGFSIGNIRELPQRLTRLRNWSGDPIAPRLQERLMRDFRQWELLQEQIRELDLERARLVRENHEAAARTAKRLMAFKGIGPNFAWILSSEFFSWRKFANRRQVGSLAGLCPTPYQSGDEHREQGVGKDGNRWVRGMAVELAWMWVHHQPDSALTQWFLRRFDPAGGRSRKVGIVAVARKILIALWRYLEFGLVPEGAIVAA